MTERIILAAQINLRSYLETAIGNTEYTLSELQEDLDRLQNLTDQMETLNKELQFLHEHLDKIDELESGEWLGGPPST